ncbi:MAG TPA: hypothetical protein VMR52_03335 [Dehalococcoidia bacterium]|nr:hypothetical protein [Dehalococcoidia bacterium]
MAFGFGRKKIDRSEFEDQLRILLTAYRDWGGEDPNVPMLLRSRLSDFERITPDEKASLKLKRLLVDVITSQVQAMSMLAVSMEKQAAGDLRSSLQEYRRGQSHLAKTNRAADVLVQHIEKLDGSDPLKKILIDTGFYDPTGGAKGQDSDSTRSEEKNAALDFLATLQWCSARQQLAMEEWNNAVATQTRADPGDELTPSPPFALTAQNAPLLMAAAENRLRLAQTTSDRFSGLDGSSAGGIASNAVSAWRRVFTLYLVRCQETVRNLRSLIDGTPASPSDEPALAREESQAMEKAVHLQRQIMRDFGVSDDQALTMFFEFMNDLRVEEGKARLSPEEFVRIHESTRPRFFGGPLLNIPDEPVTAQPASAGGMGESYCSNCRRFLAAGSAVCGYCGKSR